MSNETARAMQAALDEIDANGYGDAISPTLRRLIAKAQPEEDRRAIEEREREDAKIVPFVKGEG